MWRGVSALGQMQGALLHAKAAGVNVPGPAIQRGIQPGLEAP